MLPVLIFDFGNVVAYFDYGLIYDRLGSRLSRTGESIRTQLHEGGFAKLHAPFESGLITPVAFAANVTAGLGISLPFEEFVHDWEDIFSLNEPVAQLIASLDARGYRLILGSNTNVLHASFYRRRFAATLDRFDALVLSHELGCMKPDVRFYEACAKAANTPAGSCIFIDDMAENVAGAKAAGMQSLQYVDTAGLVAGLRELGVEIAPREG
jgi:HAD superfamily hydrolase (TIGR01509 family)